MNIKIKLIVTILAFAIGIACFFGWNLLGSKPKVEIAKTPATQQSSANEINASNKPKIDKAVIPPHGPIAKIDFRNFSYPKLGVKESIKVKEGELEYELEHCNQSYWVQGVDYQDFTGDGEDEAVVRLIDDVACGSSTVSVIYYIYGIRAGKPKLLWTFATGSESYGGSKDFHIEGKEIVIEMYGKWQNVRGQLTYKENREHSMDCCPTHYTIYRVGWNGKKFSPKSIEILPFTGVSIY